MHKAMGGHCADVAAPPKSAQWPPIALCMCILVSRLKSFVSAFVDHVSFSSCSADCLRTQVAEGEFDEGRRIAEQANMTAGQMFHDERDEEMQQQESRVPEVLFSKELAKSREMRN